MRAARTDDNHAEIRNGLREIPSMKVADTFSAGNGFPDLVCGYQGRVYLLEVKDGTKPPSKRKLTPEQEKFHAEWSGYVHVVKSLDEALSIVLKPIKTDIYPTKHSGINHK